MYNNIAAFGEHLGKSMWLIGQKVRLSSREEVIRDATITATETGLPYSEDSGLDYSFFLASRW